MTQAPPGDSEIYDRYLDEALAGRVEEPAEYLRRLGRADASLERALEDLRRLVGDRKRGPGSLPFERLGEYRIVRRLGGGGMGDVFLAEQVSLGRFVAIKTIRSEYRTSPLVSERFVREARLLARLRHPNVVTIFGFGEERGLSYFAMEIVPGRGLDELVAEAAGEGARLPAVRVARWGAGIARGLAAAHAAGILHRDVKSSNVRIATDDRPVLIDFGLAREHDSGRPTITSHFIGSPAYASPEQITAPSRTLDARTDVYSLGVTLYECLTGRLPYLGADLTEVLNRILTQPPAPPRSIVPDLPPALERIVLSALSKDPADRPADAAALAAALEAVLAPRPAPSVAATAPADRPLPAALGKYRLLELLGFGAQGRIHRAVHVELERPAAVKILDPFLVSRPEAAERFLREGRIAGRIQHPHVVRVYEVGQAEGLAYVAMELIEGRTLADRVEAEGPLPVAEAVRVVSALGGALAALHERGVLHRDVKPSNAIERSEDGRVVLADFGLAKDLAGAEALTMTGAMLGTPVAMAPEVCRGQPAVAASDQYSLAVTLYYLLTGGYPFADESPLALIHQHVQAPPPALERARPDGPPHVARAFARAMEKDPARRFPDVASFVRALKGGEAAPRAVRPRVPRLAWAGVAATVAVGIATAALLVRGEDPALEGVFAPTAVREATTGGRVDLAYSFLDPGELDDFVAGERVRVQARKGGGVALEGSGFWLTRARFRDVAIGVEVERDDPALTHGVVYAGADPARRYAGYFQTGNESELEIWLKSDVTTPENLGRAIVRHPDDARVIRLERRGRTISLGVGDEPAIRAEDGSWTSGAAGIDVQNGRLRVRSIRIEGELDPDWLAAHRKGE